MAISQTALREAMRQLEAANPDLRGMLPKGYTRRSSPRRFMKGRPALSPIDLSNEDYGALFADLLLRVAQEEGHDGGDLFVTAPHIVDLMVAIVAPSEGRVFDPCSGSGGMFTGCLRTAVGNLTARVSVSTGRRSRAETQRYRS